MSLPEAPKNIELNIPFTIEKGSRKAKWKIVEHPYFDDAYALVRDYRYMGCDDILKLDCEHIVSGSKTIEKAWQQAYDHT